MVLVKRLEAADAASKGQRGSNASRDVFIHHDHLKKHRLLGDVDGVKLFHAESVVAGCRVRLWQLVSPLINDDLPIDLQKTFARHAKTKAKLLRCLVSKDGSGPDKVLSGQREVLGYVDQGLLSNSCKDRFSVGTLIWVLAKDLDGPAKFVRFWAAETLQERAVPES